jgi:DNA-binding winged helix-turn-helix (wHTH) protein
MHGDTWRRFDEFALNLETGELRRNGLPTPLERQPARVLAILVGRAGELVPREALQRAVWAGDVHVDFERGLNYCVRQIRAVLGDDAKTPRFVETLPRQGYRFIMAVAVDARPPRPTPSARRWVLAGAVVLALVIWMEAATPNQAHHHVAVAVLRSVHDFLF